MLAEEGEVWFSHFWSYLIFFGWINCRNITTLAQDHTVYAIDLLGFGLSEKPAGFMYTMEVWAGVYIVVKLDALNAMLIYC